MGKDKTNEIKPEKHKKEMTEKAIKANKLNALKSTGPKTPRAEGELPPNLKHGILASIKVLPEVESQQEWDDFVVGLKKDLHPFGTLEVALTERIAWILWRFKRLVNYEEGNLNLKFVRSLEDYVNSLVFTTPDDFTDIALMLTYYGFNFFERIVTSFHKINEIIRNIKIGVVTGSIDTELGTDIAKLLGLVQFWLLCRGNEKNAAIRYSNNMIDFVNFTLKIHDRVFSDLSVIYDFLVNDININQEDPAVLIKKLYSALEEFYVKDNVFLMKAIVEYQESRSDVFLPNNEKYEKILKMESHLNRQLMQNLHELQRLQAMRVGISGPPLAVDVSGSE